MAAISSQEIGTWPVCRCVPIEDIQQEGETWYAYTYPGRGSIAVLVDHPDRPQVEMEIGAVYLIFGWKLKVEGLLADWRAGKD